MRMHKPLVAALLLVAVVGCGGSGGDRVGSTGSRSKVTVPSWAAEILAAPGPEGAAVMASSDLAVGDNRVAFLLVRANGARIERHSATVFYRPVAAGPTRAIRADPLRIGVEGGGHDVRGLYVAQLRFPAAGKFWIVVRPAGTAFQGFQLLEVKRRHAAPAVGDRAVASANPTLALLPAKKITTARPPDTALLRHSVADSLERGIPFVVAFATPAYCTSRTCGPTVDVVEAVRKRYAAHGIRFIHVEIYEGNKPHKGVNRWVREWRLPTEPWVFVVDGEGTIRARFEGAVSIDELAHAVREASA
jgi:hypothetical protein